MTLQWRHAEAGHQCFALGAGQWHLLQKALRWDLLNSVVCLLECLELFELSILGEHLWLSQ